MIILGVDLGLDGALVALDSNMHIIARAVMPTVSGGGSKREYDGLAIVKFIRDAHPDHVVIEKHGARPGQGVVSMVSIGYGAGLIRGIITAQGIPYTIVTPQAWQKVMLAGMTKDDTKAAAAIVCSRLWPSEDWRASPR